MRPQESVLLGSKRKKNAKLAYQGHVYDRASYQIEYVTYYCEKRRSMNCKGKLKRNAEGNCEIVKPHSHPPNIVKTKVDILKVGRFLNFL